MTHSRASRALRTTGILLFTLFGISNAVSAPLCTRNDLNSIATAYLRALQSHAPSAVTLAPTLTFTENGRTLPIGQGFCRTAGEAHLIRTAVDVSQCAVHIQAVIQEGDRPIVFGARIKTAAAGISELETFVARENDFAFNARGLLDTQKQDWQTILPLEQRSSRLAMIAAADDYFEMFVSRPKVNVPFADHCDRWENGTLTTISSSPVSTVPGRRDHDCSPKGLVTPHHKPRRFLVDVETGVVVAYVLFASIHPDFHMFKMRNGRIELIQAVVGSMNGTTGWRNEPVCHE